MLAAAPAAVLLSLPASAAPAPTVTPVDGRCALALLVPGASTVSVTVTAVATGAAVDVLDDGVAQPVPPTVRALPAEGPLVVALDARDVPDTDPRVKVATSSAGVALPERELALPDCRTAASPAPSPSSSPAPSPSSPASPEPSPSATTAPSDAPSPSTAPAAPVAPEPSSPAPSSPAASSPAATSPAPAPSASAPAGTPTPGSPSPSASASPSASPGGSAGASPSAAPSGGPSTSPRPSASASPRPDVAVSSAGGPARPAAPSTPAPATSPVLVGPSSTGTTGGSSWSFGAAMGSGSSGYLSLSAFTGTGTSAATDVPDPVIAAPQGSAAGAAAALGLPSPLADLLPEPTQTEDLAPQLPTLGAPSDLSSSSVDPLVELAPAAFVLSASLGGLVLARRRSA